MVPVEPPLKLVAEGLDQVGIPDEPEEVRTYPLVPDGKNDVVEVLL